MKQIRYTGGKGDRNLDIQNLENILKQSLEPVKPRQEFVNRLQGQLKNPAPPSPVKIGLFQYLLFISAALAGSILILITTVKAIVSVVEAFRALRNKRSQPNSISFNRSTSFIKSASAGS